MFKRLIWTGTGMAVGAAGAFWAKHKVERTVEHYLPDQVAQRVGTSTREMGRTVRAAATEGRDAMRATEADLRARVEARTFTGPDPVLEEAVPAESPAAPASGEREAAGGSGGKRRMRQGARAPRLD